MNVPPSLATEHTVHSAPAEVQGRYTLSDAPVSLTSPEVRDPFDSISGKDTLLSFPSITDSAPSEWGGTAAVDSREIAKKERLREPVKSPKRYPRGSADDDEEESVNLFRKGTISSEGDDSSTVMPPPSGIRLVSMNQREYF